MMEIEHGELRIVQGRHKNFLILKIFLTCLTTVVGLLVPFFYWTLKVKDTGLFAADVHGIHSSVGDKIVNTTWSGTVFFCVYLLLFPVLLGSRYVKLVIQVIIETVQNMYRKIDPRRQGLFFCATVISVPLIGCILFVASRISLSIIQYPLHLRSSEDPSVYFFDVRSKFYNQSKPPYLITNVTRYNTEDVLLMCEFPVTSNSEETASAIMQLLYWTKDNKGRITETDKIHINTTVLKNTRYKLIDSEFLIKSVLTIELIDDGDYGTYSCKYLDINLNEKMLQPSTGDAPSHLIVDVDHQRFYNYKPFKIQQGLELMDLTEITNSVFHLEKQEMPVKTARVSPGGVFIDHVPYWSLADPGDITFNTTISGKDNADCCWLPARLYKYFFGYENLVWRRKTGDQHQRYLIRQQCVCVEDLVLNNSTVAFVRARYNSTTKRQESLEVGHPRQVIFMLDLPCVFRFHQLIGESLWLRNDYQNCAITNDSSAFCRQRFQNIIGWFNNVMLVDIFNWIFCFTATIVPLSMSSFVTRGWIRHVLLTLQKILFDPPPNTKDYTYDLYLMYDEEDRYETQLAKTLRELIETATFSVFDPWRDIIPGHLLPTEQERAIEQSRTFCVIISNSTEIDDEKQFELVAIKKTLAARTVPNTDINDSIFTIKIGDFKVDSFLSPVKANVPVNDRVRNTLDQDVLHTFSEWTLACKASWIKLQLLQRGNRSRRFRPHALSMLKQCFIFACHNMLLCFLLIGFLASDFQYMHINDIRRNYYEAE